MNRLTHLMFPDQNGDQGWTCTPDGLPATITTWNDGGSKSVVNAYTYNKRRLPVGESVQQPLSSTDSGGVLSQQYAYDANGNASSITDALDPARSRRWATTPWTA